MASSFISQVPSIIYLIQRLGPKTVLDIGKGFGKYGFLIHEYAGIDNKKKIDATRTLAEQSKVIIDAVEVDPDLMMPHLSHIYNKVYFNDILAFYEELPNYDLVLLIDIIEHLDKIKAIAMINHFLSRGMKLIIATPLNFFKQDLYESVYEHHVSHWTLKDFESMGQVSYQNFDGGMVYLVSQTPVKVNGFGSDLKQKTIRLLKSIRNELLS